MIELRSDTFTKPTVAMRAVMASAEVGDDVFGEDPTVNRLEARTAELFGKEAALFVPSGTMSNQIGIRVHTQPGDEMLCDGNCHIYNYENGGAVVLSGVSPRTVDGEYGILDVSQLADKIRPINDHMVRTRLVCLENTHNRGGGSVYPLAKIQAIREWTQRNGLLLHLDGARLWNAVVATGIAARTWADQFDSVSVCFSKGLGAPVGSALAGPREYIAKARRVRKLFGGAMRQAGILAAAALYALDNHVERLAEDHRHARLLAEAIQRISGLRLTPPAPETNILIVQIDPRLGSAIEVAARLLARGVRVLPTAPQTMRLVTHLDVSREQAEEAAERIRGMQA